MPQDLTDQREDREDLLGYAIAQFGFSRKSAEKRLVMLGSQEEFKKDLDAVAKSIKLLGKKGAVSKLLELGRDGLEEFTRRLASKKNIPPVARKQEGDAILADLCWANMRPTRGVAWVVVMEGNNILAKLDLLIVYDGKLKGPQAKLPKAKGKGFTKLHTYGLGTVLGEQEWATFGLIPPKGRPFSKWGPSYFEGDPKNKANLTSAKRLADSMKVDSKLSDIMAELGYDKRAGGGIPISFLKRAVNDTMKLAGYHSKPRWIPCVISKENPIEDIEMIGVPEIEERLLSFWVCDDHSEEDEGVSVFDE